MSKDVEMSGRAVSLVQLPNRVKMSEQRMQIRLVYTSNFKPHMSDDDIAALVDKAATFNRQQGITGVLAVEGLRVCQILEGATEAVDALFSSIRRDPRHGSVNLLERREITKQHFQDWGMVRRPMIDMVTFAFAI